MKKSSYLIIGAVLVSIAGIVHGYSLSSSQPNTSFAQGMASMDTSGMSEMMNQIPKDVVIKVQSSQTIYQGKAAELILQILDKSSNAPLKNSNVLIGIEKGASMTTMEMQGGMTKDENKGNGNYLVSFTPSEKGIYTLHVHVIPDGKSMHSMMENHMDIGLISK